MNIQVKTLRYENKDVIKKTSFFLAKGLNVISGESGSGKTTLFFYLIKYFYENDVQFIASDQSGALISNLNVQENIEFTKNPQLDCSLIYQKLGIYPLLNKNIDQLSGGERKRVVLTKMLLSTSELIMCDEITANIDEEYNSYFIEYLKTTTKTVILFTHNKDFYDIANAVLEIKDNKIIQKKLNDEYSPLTKEIKYSQIDKLTKPKWVFLSIISVIIFLLTWLIFAGAFRTYQGLINEVESGNPNGINIMPNSKESKEAFRNYEEYYFDVGNAQSENYITDSQVETLLGNSFYEYYTFDTNAFNNPISLSIVNPRPDSEVTNEIYNYEDDSFYYGYFLNEGFTKSDKNPTIAFTNGNELSEDVLLFGANQLSTEGVAIPLPLALQISSDPSSLIGTNYSFNVDIDGQQYQINATIEAITNDYEKIIFNNPKWFFQQINFQLPPEINEEPNVQQITFYGWNFEKYQQLINFLETSGLPILVQDPIYKLKYNTYELIMQLFKLLIIIIIVCSGLLIINFFMESNKKTKHQKNLLAFYCSGINLENYLKILKTELKNRINKINKCLLIIFAIMTTLIIINAQSPLLVTIALIIAFIMTIIFVYIVNKIQHHLVARKVIKIYGQKVVNDNDWNK